METDRVAYKIPVHGVISPVLLKRSHIENLLNINNQDIRKNVQKRDI